MAVTPHFTLAASATISATTTPVTPIARTRKVARARVMLDTGGSISAITPDLASRAGIEIAPGGMQSRARMASGKEVQVSVIRLKSIRIGLARIDNLGVALYEPPGLRASWTGS